MRARTNIGIATVLSKVVEEKTLEQESLDMHVAVDGPTAAAWIVKKHKRQLRKVGAVDLVIPDTELTPPYIRIGLETLRRRRKWLVVTQTMRGKRRYRIRWLEWGNNTRAAREAGWGIDE